jgi:hypothetical protein
MESPPRVALVSGYSVVPISIIMIAAEVYMHPMIWLIILGPPCLALVISRGGGMGAKTKDITLGGGFKVDVWQSVQLGRYGFWIVLAIIYTVTLAAALVEHKI